MGLETSRLAVGRLSCCFLRHRRLRPDVSLPAVAGTGRPLPFFLLPVAGLLTGICALPLGWVALRTRRHVFMVISIAIFALCTGLPDLLSAHFTSMAEISLPIPTWGADIYNLPFYYASLVLVLVALGISWSVRHSKYGLGLLAIRDDEGRAQGLGVNVGAYKLAAYVLSGILVGMAGALNAYFLGFISPTSAFDRTANITLPLMAFLGGVGTVSGPLLGALIEVPLQQYLTMQVGTQGWTSYSRVACSWWLSGSCQKVSCRHS